MVFFLVSSPSGSDSRIGLASENGLVAFLIIPYVLKNNYHGIGIMYAMDI